MRKSEVIKNECALRLTSNIEQIQSQHLQLPILLTDLEKYFETLENYVEINIEEINQFVQQIELALPNQTLFLEKFRRCIYGLCDRNIVHNVIITSTD
jgi:hypothetical protein